MKKTILIALTILMFFASCANPQKENHTTTSEIFADTADGCMDLYTELNEIVLFSDKTFLFYKHLSADSLLVIWGNTKYGQVQYDTLPMFPIGPPLYEWSNDEVICLRQSCGTACFFAYVMLFRSGEIKQYMYPLAYDVAMNRIAYSGSDNPDVLLVIEDLLTGNKKEIMASYKPGVLSAHSIDSIKFTAKGLYVKWLDINSKHIEKIFE